MAFADEVLASRCKSICHRDLPPCGCQKVSVCGLPVLPRSLCAPTMYSVQLMLILHSSCLLSVSLSSRSAGYFLAAVILAPSFLCSGPANGGSAMSH